MIVLATSMLSLAYRRRRTSEAEAKIVHHLQDRIRDRTPVAIPGIVLQELLTGVREETAFESLLNRLDGFPILTATPAEHIQAAQILNRCTRAGIACGTVDALIAAQTVWRDGELMTLDADFSRIAPLCGLKLYKV